jgi:phage gpG-like protein
MSVEASRAIAFLEQFPAKYRERLVKVMQRVGFDLQGYVQRNKLQGQVLNHRTGWLSSHVHADTEEDGNKVRTTVGVDSNAVPYAAIHEYGGKINVPEVVGKLMRFETGGDIVFAMSHRAFSFTMPERSYLRSSLSERKAVYIDWIRGAARAA